MRVGCGGLAASRKMYLHRRYKDELKQGKLADGNLCFRSRVNELMTSVEVLKQRRPSNECTEARWGSWNCSDPTAAALGFTCRQASRSAPLSSPPALARGHGPITIVGWLHANKPWSRVQPTPLFAPLLSVIDTSSSPNLSVTQHFSVRITREGPAVTVDTPPPSTPFCFRLSPSGAIRLALSQFQPCPE